MKGRTGESRCVVCLRSMSTEEFLANDYVCGACAEREHPLQSSKA